VPSVLCSVKRTPPTTSAYGERRVGERRALGDLEAQLVVRAVGGQHEHDAADAPEVLRGRGVSVQRGPHMAGGGEEDLAGAQLRGAASRRDRR
jgi:hypothetical protein